MSDALDASLRQVRAQAALVKRFDASLGGLHGVSLADVTTLLPLGQAPGGRMRRVDLAEALGADGLRGDPGAGAAGADRAGDARDGRP